MIGERRLISRFGGRDEVDRDRDVLLEEVRQTVAGRLAVVRDDRRADVLLVLQEAPGCRVGIWRAGDGGNDVLARPDDVIRPQLAQRDADRLLRGTHDLTPSPPPSALAYR
jgi:hypothetical protein